jgi:hypothetical protein
MKSGSKLLIILFLCNVMSVNLFGQINSVERKATLQNLLQYKDKNLFADELFDTRKEATRMFEKLAFDKEKIESRNKFPIFAVRYIWKIQSKGKQQNYVVMDSQTLFISPGQQIQSFYFFNNEGSLINTVKFSTGRRMMVNSVSLKITDDFEFPVVKIAAGGFGSFAYSAHTVQYYALLNDSIVLVRLEAKPNYVNVTDNQNLYGCEYPAIGPKMPERTIGEWVAALSSDNEADILETLTWLGGSHSTIEELERDQKQEDEFRKNNPNTEFIKKTTLEKCPYIINQIQTYEGVKYRQDVLKRLHELSASRKSWIKEAADSVLEGLNQK